jgi:hypothetical protein
MIKPITLLLILFVLICIVGLNKEDKFDIVHDIETKNLICKEVNYSDNNKCSKNVVFCFQSVNESFCRVKNNSI